MGETTMLRRTSRIAQVTSRRCTRAFVTAKSEGQEGSENFKLGYWNGSDACSPWHDIPVSGNTSGTVNMVVEIPRYTFAKMEVDTKAEHNPIIQDTKKASFVTTTGPFSGTMVASHRLGKTLTSRTLRLVCLGIMILLMLSRSARARSASAKSAR